MTEMILCNSLQASGSHSPSALFPDNQLILVLNFQFKPEPDVFFTFLGKEICKKQDFSSYSFQHQGKVDVNINTISFQNCPSKESWKTSFPQVNLMQFCICYKTWMQTKFFNKIFDQSNFLKCPGVLSAQSWRNSGMESLQDIALFEARLSKMGLIHPKKHNNI